MVISDKESRLSVCKWFNSVIDMFSPYDNSAMCTHIVKCTEPPLRTRCHREIAGHLCYLGYFLSILKRNVNTIAIIAIAMHFNSPFKFDRYSRHSVFVVRGYRLGLRLC